MAETNIIKSLQLGTIPFEFEKCWEQLGIDKLYMLHLLTRDEYTPVLEKQPTESDVIYTDPASQNPAAFHAGQVVVYPDSEMPDGLGMSIAKFVQFSKEGEPTKVYWFHVSELEKRVHRLEAETGLVAEPIFKYGRWRNPGIWTSEMKWLN